MMEQIKKAFDAIATEYDSLREFVIPDLQQFYTTSSLGSRIFSTRAVNP